jgi:hypothetical protein
LDTTDNRAFTIFTVKLEQIEERTEQRGGQEEKRKPKQKKVKILHKNMRKIERGKRGKCHYPTMRRKPKVFD